MTPRIHLVLALALLSACGAPPAPAPSEPDVLSLSRAAVEHTPAPVTEGTLPAPLLADAVAAGPSNPPVPPAPPVEEAATVSVVTTSFRLRHGETLDHFAKWSELPVEEIAALSELDLTGEYAVGTEVRIPVEGEALTALEARRAEHWQRRIDGYLASRGGQVGLDVYSVRTGDTAWSIAKEGAGVPIWVIASYNPDVSLDRIRPGQKLMVPALADTLVDATPLPE